MGSCCGEECGLAPESGAQKRTLTLVLGINAIMFVVIVASAIAARSTSLLADSLDNLGDALTYGASLLVVAKGIAAKARVALFKGSLILFAALIVSAQIVYIAFVPGHPEL